MEPKKRLAVADVVLLIVGIILLAVGIALIPFFNKKIRSTVEQNVKLVNNSEAFNSWKSPPAPMYLTFYFFNITNRDDVIQNSSKPHLQEIGPFTYREYRNKTNIEFRNNGETIYYKEHKYYVYDQTASNGSEDAMICTINIPILTVATEVRYMNIFIQWGLEFVLHSLGETLFQCHTVKELLWGYTPVSIEKINEFLRNHSIHFRLNFTYGIYSGPTANGTDDGELEIYSGVQHLDRLGLVREWKGNSTLPYWNGPCSSINGSDGTLWHPFINKTETLYIFNTDICRSVYVTYNRDSSVSSSKIPTYRLTPPPEVMADPHVYPENRCFCSPYDANGTFCLGAGVLNVSSCRYNAPVIMSQPHFFEAPEYVDDFVGLNPDKKKHQTILDVEPYTGLVLNGAKRIQVNMFVSKLICLHETNNEYFEKGIVFPVSWISEHATVPDDVAAKFYQTVYGQITLANGLRYGLIALGGFLLLCAVVLTIVILAKRQKPEEVPVSDAEPDETSPLIVNRQI